MLHVLLVDDSAIARRVGVRLLTAGGATVEEAGSLAGGVSAARSRRFDAALLDLELGDGTGITLADELRARAPECRIAFVSATTEGPLLSAARARAPVFVKAPEGYGEAVGFLLGRDENQALERPR